MAATSHSISTCLVTEKSMPSDRRQVDQRMVDAAVRDVLDDRLAGVELLGGAVRGFARRAPERALVVLNEHRVDVATAANRRRIRYSASISTSAMK